MVSKTRINGTDYGSCVGAGKHNERNLLEPPKRVKYKLVVRLICRGVPPWAPLLVKRKCPLIK